MIPYHFKPTAALRYLLLAASFWLISLNARSQTTLAPGELAFVGYITTDDGVNGLAQDDEFSFILLKDISAGTVIRFTDFGWLSTNVFQTANTCGPNTGAINDGIITWTASANMTCGTQVRIKCKYTLQATAGTVTGIQVCSNNPAAYLSLANGGDQIFAYQGTQVAPAFIAGISINKAWDVSLINCFFSSNSSVLPAALSAGANNTAVTGGINAKYNCTVTNALPPLLIAAINNPSNWQTDNTFFPPVPVAFQLPLPCSFGCNSPIITTTGTLNPFSACSGFASAEQTFTVSGINLTANIIISAPAGFEVSTASGTGFGASVTLVQSGGTVNTTTIYVRMAATASGTPSGNITCASTGATTQNVAVSGTVNPSPTITCPANITVNNTAGQCGSIVNYNTTVTGIPAPTATYAFTGATTGTGSGNGTGSFFNKGVTTVTVTVTNLCGTSNCSFTVTVNDTQVPSITCPANITVSNNTNQCGAVVNFNVTANDNCPGVTVTSVPASGSFFPIGTTTVTSTATDAAGNTAICTFTVRVNDTQLPAITCPANMTVSNNANQCGAVVNYPAPTASDNCPGVTVVSTPASGSFFPIGTTTVTATATDAAGNTSTCTFTVTVNDTQAPSITCPANITVNNTPNQCGAVVTYPAPTASDNCPGVTVVSTPASGSFFPVGTTTVTATATDAAGNTATCTFTVRVNDIQTPTITCPAAVTVSCVSAVPAPNIASVTVSDNCPGVVVTFVGDVISNQTCTNRYTITRTYRATDAAGNTATCTQTITVNDQTPPVLTCPAPVTVSCASAVPAPNIASVTGVSDNCTGGVTVTHVGDVISNQTCANRYTITRTYRATDACGNFAQCTQIITVNDQTAPVLSCPNITVTTPIGSCTAVVNYTLTATDNCTGAVTIVSVPASGSVFQIGTTTVNSTATDVCGNSSTCSFTVTVIDGQLPVITTQPANRNVCVGANAVFSVISTNALGFQWQAWNGTSWNNIAGATGSTFTVNNATLSMNTNSYRVVLTGLCSNLTSNVATLYVNPVPTILLVASRPPSLLPGQFLSITAVINPPGGGGSYAWFRNSTLIVGATGPVLANLTVDDIGVYHVVYTDPNGCSATSADMIVSGAPSDHLYIYPNPSSGHFHIRFYNQDNEEVTVRIFDMKGAVVYFRKVLTVASYSDIEIELTNNRITPGAGYLVVVRGANGRLIGSKRIIVFK
jgi:HYR domain/Secretion system C-terminal sorting domain